MDGAPPDAEWQALLAGDASRAGGLAPLFAPVLAPGSCVVGRLAQTLDGRIATRSGHSQWIGGPGDLRHTHRLRALCQAVVVGAGSVGAAAAGAGGVASTTVTARSGEVARASSAASRAIGR